MTPARAKEVLEGMVLDDFNTEALWCSHMYVKVWVGIDGAALEGGFTADQLEAIACWMREPKLVVEAK